MKTLTKQDEKPLAPESRQERFTTPRVNISESGDHYVLEAELPGVPKDGLEISVEGTELTIIGRRSDETPTGVPVYRESRPADYRRSFDLDPLIDTGKIKAKIEHGVLQVTLPKAESVKPRKVKVD